jgi:hypothetical protein
MRGISADFNELTRDIRKMMVPPEPHEQVYPNQQVKATLTRIKNTLAKNAPSDDQIKAAVAELILSNDEARYVLSRLASRMQTGTKEVKIDETNLEHIFPKNAGAREWGGGG